MIQPLRALKFRIQERWRIKSPAEKWDFITNIGKVLGHSVGIRTYSDMKVYWYSASSGLMIVIFVYLEFYTLQYYFRRSDFVRGFECTYVLGVAIGVRVKSGVRVKFACQS